MSTLLMKRNVLVKIAAISVIFFSLGACTPGNTQQVKDTHQKATLAGYEAAADLYRTKDYNFEDLYQLLLAGKSLHDAGYWHESNVAFDLAEKKLRWKADKVDTAGEVLSLVGTTLTNDTMSAYPGKIYEGVMINYYQALNYLMLGSEDKALVRFNRLGERQKNASVQLRQYEMALKNVKNENITGNQINMLSTSVKQVHGEINEGIRGLPSKNSRTYIRNQAGDILHAIFRSTNHKKADDWQIPKLLQQARNNSLDRSSSSLTAIIEDSLGQKNNKYTYVIYENGTGPHITENRIDLPLSTGNSGFVYFGVALPKFNKGYNSSYSFEVPGASSIGTVTNINNMAGIEFQTSYNEKVDKALISAFLKALAQHALNEEFHDSNSDPMVNLFANVLTAAVAQELTKADLRAWTNLPNRIDMAVIPNENSNDIVVTVAGENISIAIDNKENNIIYLRKAKANGQVKAFVQTLPAKSLAKEIM